jgi:hypothetical protein
VSILCCSDKPEEAAMLDLAVRLNQALDRHRKVLNAVAVAAMVLMWAHYARFIHLPEVVALPVVVTGLATGARYALWEGWLKPRIAARSAETQAEP